METNVTSGSPALAFLLDNGGDLAELTAYIHHVFSIFCAIVIHKETTGETPPVYGIYVASERPDFIVTACLVRKLWTTAMLPFLGEALEAIEFYLTEPAHPFPWLHYID